MTESAPQFEHTPSPVMGDHTPYLLQRWVPETMTWSVYDGIWAENDAEAVECAQRRVNHLHALFPDFTWQVTRVLAAAGPELVIGVRE